jgi:deoxyribonuclease V
VWPSSIDDLMLAQERLGRERPALWRPPAQPRVAGCFAVFAGEEPGAPMWASAATVDPPETATVSGASGAEDRPGLLALRAGPMLEAAVRALREPPDVLLVDATGRDHPRRAGLAVQLGSELGVATIGITYRPLVASGEEPAAERGASAPLRVDGEVVGAWLRIQPRARPIAVHAAWQTDVETALAVVLGIARRVRTPEPLRAARRAARLARAVSA